MLKLLLVILVAFALMMWRLCAVNGDYDRAEEEKITRDSWEALETCNDDCEVCKNKDWCKFYNWRSK